MFIVEWPVGELEKAEVKTQEDLRRFGVEFIQEICNAVVRDTPVKTGFLKGSWFGNVGSEPSGEGSIGRDSAAQLNEAAQSWQLGDTYYATNFAKYAAFVEFGTRYMTARAWVRGALTQVPEIAKMVAARIKGS